MLHHVKKRKVRSHVHLIRTPPGLVIEHPTGRRPREDPGHAGETVSLPGNTSGSLGRTGRRGWGRQGASSLSREDDFPLVGLRPAPGYSQWGEKHEGAAALLQAPSEAAALAGKTRLFSPPPFHPDTMQTSAHLAQYLKCHRNCLNE